MRDDQDKLLDLFHREKDRFMAFARRQIWGVASLDPEDIVSDVFQTLLDRGDLVGEIEHLAAYVYRALGNRILDYRRREGRALPSGDLDLERLPDPGADPHQAFQARQDRERLIQAVDGLKPKERAVWLATVVERRRFRDLATLWGEPVGTLISRKSRATAKLRRQLADLDPSRS
jgi:RNA polymerase sigma factor (sigma-70 family)